MSGQSIGERFRSSISFLSFQGETPDLELTKEVYDALKVFSETGKCDLINKVSWKIHNKCVASDDFSFLKRDQLKFVCAILIFLFSKFYRSQRNKHGDVLLKLIDMMINKATRDDIDKIITELNLTYYYNDEIMAYSVKCTDILNLNPDEFLTSTMDTLGFD